MLSLLDVVSGLDVSTFTEEIYPKRQPVILRGVDIGQCVDKWRSVNYLTTQGGQMPVKIHVSATPQMDFIKKNFSYKSLPFSDFVQRASEDEHTEFFETKTENYYLRALGDDPRKDKADIHQQFPRLADDIKFPKFFPPEKLFSSVFRIASKGTQLWTHYDVMDNLLMQVVGRKRVILFSPAEVDKMYLNGDKSEVLDIDNPDPGKFPKFLKAHRHEGILEPGDILFIPALWFHNVIYKDYGVAVNVFWKHLDDSLYDHRDVYGNKDHVPYSRAQQILDRALKTLEELPEEYREFYGHRLISRIEKKVLQKDKPP
ncbi:tRNA wybutosine-synthesizing protein 5-like [Mizuhopecten yessoensis]|uniref:tRNA wybutosine-synthesizing protein 5 n=1 Tax=Mizuhopecten yessoensis TaxID=6573 RepID=A0A210QRN3_MIZYE|nr:tRNA wybutosine-synthesizing protein 5-like [Mizuhopecten yessoensis]OWF51395.1 tRNA wybutosine-synthesizing protein 5 [Mizuhopecten yessoensis]